MGEFYILTHFLYLKIRILNIETIMNDKPSPTLALSISSSWRSGYRPPPLPDLLDPAEGPELSGRSSRQSCELYCILLRVNRSIPCCIMWKLVLFTYVAQKFRSNQPADSNSFLILSSIASSSTLPIFNQLLTSVHLYFLTCVDLIMEIVQERDQKCD